LFVLQYGKYDEFLYYTTSNSVAVTVLFKMK